MIDFPNTPQRPQTWTTFKALAPQKAVQVQYEESADCYCIYGYDLPEVLTCTIWRAAVPDAVVVGGYSQAQNDSDKADFEANFKPYANRPITNPRSLILATTLKSGGSANLAVNGSAVTPVVFEYTPPNNYDIEITAISLLFEDVTVFAFGNNFIRSGLAPLTNGLVLSTKAGDQVVNPWHTMRRTRDIVAICESFNIVTGATNFLRVAIRLPRSLRLFRQGTFVSPDYLRVTVCDNLTAFDFAEAHFQGVRI
jgi:hypothetical protein